MTRLRSRPARPRRSHPSLDDLGTRVVPAVTATFAPAAGLLAVTGDDLNNAVVVGRTAAGAILVNGGAVAVTGGTPTVANTATIQVFGQGATTPSAWTRPTGPGRPRAGRGSMSASSRPRRGPSG